MDIKNAQQWIEKGTAILTEYTPKIILAIVIWVIGLRLIKHSLKLVKKLMDAKNYDVSLEKFLMSLINWALKIMLILTVLGTVGIQTTSLAAIMAAASLAIGMALQGSLANFAGGVLIMIFKPFKVGDFIIFESHKGTVKHIDIFTTKLTTVDNKLIIIPNGPLSNNTVTNVSAEENLRVDLTFGVGYDSDIKSVKNTLTAIVTNNDLVLKDPAPVVLLSELADSSINFVVRAWTKNKDYWTVYHQTLEEAKNALDAAGIDIPYPHQVEIVKQL